MNKLTVGCDCTSNCSILVLERFGPNETWVDIYTRVGRKTGLFTRLRTAWAILWGMDHALDGLILNPQDVAQVAKFFSQN